MRNIYVTNTPLQQAREKWRKALTECGFFNSAPTEKIKVDDSRGRLTAEPVVAEHSSPSYNAAAMDGIAVRFGDLSGASEASPVVLSTDRYQPVNTGNALPGWANGVIMIEDVHTREDGSV